MHSIEKYMRNGVVLLDGGMGQELRHRAANEPTSLWSAQVLIEQPELVQEVHEDYIRAGASVITTNSYATVRSRLEAIDGMGSEYEKLIDLAGVIANRARDAVGKSVLIAGSMPPLNGSYRPDRVMQTSELEPVYREHAERLAPHVDVLLCETMSTAEEARVAANEASRVGLPVWVAWTLVDDELADSDPEQSESSALRSGESLAEAYTALTGLSIEAVMSNCCTVESVSASIKELQSMHVPLFGGYANGFAAIPKDWTVQSAGVDVLGQRKDNSPERYAAAVSNWIDQGATIVGGCCEITPAHIAAIREMIDNK